MTLDILMPFYGRLDYLQLAVQSILAQNDESWRLTVIDDSFPDPEPGRWLGSITDDRVTYVRNEENLGVTGNFAKAASLARADFCTIIGCDDALLPGYVRQMRTLIAEFPDASYIQPRVEVIDTDGTVVRPLADRVKDCYRGRGRSTRIMRGEALAVSLLRGNWTYFPSICWRRELLQKYGFRTDLSVALDLAMQLDIVAGGGSLVVTEELLFRYRRHADSVSSFTAADSTRFREEEELFAATALRMSDLGWHKAARAATRHYSSRLNAATRLPAALLARDRDATRGLIHHMVGSTR